MAVRLMAERSRSELVLDAIWSIQFGDVSKDRKRLRNAEARALLEAYLEAKTALSELRIEAQRLAGDAAAQRAVIERLTNELDKRQQ
jgi:hypothetical protein